MHRFRSVCLWLCLVGSAAAREPQAGTPRDLLQMTHAGRLASSPWLLHMGAVAGWPMQESEFRDGWRYGLGLAGGLRRRLGAVAAAGLEAEFLHFRRGDRAGEDVSGGARRYGRIAVPLHLRLYQHPGERRTRLEVQASAGYVHESVGGITGLSQPSPAERSDGFAWTAGLVLSRRGFQQTRYTLGARYAGLSLPDRSPAHFAFVLGVEMPLAGSRVR